ncbi:AI-2E family transporter [Streptomyces bambusae]|uniref:AI-2E family transporter n=1 Tax=Streptomyces bambusae TaxID=1550616 RepID=UPI001CFC6D90|nr:AI-2E family transporter [Streptomyces bambusae]MCB5167333.1 AI-2E family transporter [Streptomyces bambusae]
MSDLLARAKGAAAALERRRAGALARHDAEAAAERQRAVRRSAPARDRAPDPARAVPWGIRVAAELAWRFLVLAAAVWVLMRVIGAVRLVALAFVAGLLITALLQPTVARLHRRGLPRGLATLGTALCGFLALGLIGWFVVWQVLDNLGSLSERLQEGIAELKRWLLDSPFHVTEQQINDVTERLSDAIGTSASEITSTGLQGVTVLIEVITGMLLAMFITLFLLYDGRRVWEWTLKLLPAAVRPAVAGAGTPAWRTLTAYIRGTLIVALIDAVFIGVGIYFLGVPLAVPIAVVIFLASFVPLIGAIASGALAVIVALVTRGVFTAVMTLVVVLLVQQIEGHILQPFILGRAVRIHPLAVALSVATGGLVAGIGGAVVAVPLVAVANTVITHLRAHAGEDDEPAPEPDATPDPDPAPPATPPGPAPPAADTNPDQPDRPDQLDPPAPDRPPTDPSQH